MFKSAKNDTDNLELLEANVVKAAADLTAAKATYRATRLDFEDAKDRLAEKESPDRQTDYNAALARTRAASQAIDFANKALTEATRVIEVAKTKPLRQASAKRIDEAVAVLKKAHPAVRAALAPMCAALDAASFQEVAAMSAPGGLFSHWVRGANEAAVGGDLEKFIVELEAYRDGILDGTRPATLAPTLADQRAGKAA